MANLPTTELFWRASQPVAKVVFIAACGAVARRQGVLKTDVLQALSRLNMYIFTPTLIFTKLASAINPSRMADWWFIPFNVFCSSIFGFGLGVLVVCATRPKADLRTVVIVCTGLGNMGNLPLVLIQSICDTTGDSFGPNCEEAGFGYVSFGIWVATVIQWTFVYQLMHRSSQQTLSVLSPDGLPLVAPPSYEQVAAEDIDMDRGDLVADTATVEAGSRAPGGCSTYLESMELAPANGHADEALPPEQRGGSREECSRGGLGTAAAGAEHGQEESRPSKYKRSVTWGDGYRQGAEEEEEGTSQGTGNATGLEIGPRGSSIGKLAEGEAARAEGAGLVASMVAAAAHAGGASSWGLSKAMSMVPEWATPPFNACALALTVGAVPGVKGVLFGPAAPLRALTDGMEVLGDAMIPTMLLVLGANLSSGPGYGSASVGYSTIAGIAVARLVVVPAVGVLFVGWAKTLGAMPPHDALFHMVLLLQNASPTAINLNTIATLHGVGQAEVAAILFWEYLLAVVTSTLWIMVFLGITLQ